MVLVPCDDEKGNEGKWILKKALEPLVPNVILYRAKQGFATPLTQVFRDQAHEVRVRLLGPAMADCGLFDLAAIEKLVAEHEMGQFDHSGALWLLLTFEGFLAMADTKSDAKTALAA